MYINNLYIVPIASYLILFCQVVVLEYVSLLFTTVLKLSSIYIGLKYNKNKLGAKNISFGVSRNV